MAPLASRSSGAPRFIFSLSICGTTVALSPTMTTCNASRCRYSSLPLQRLRASRLRSSPGTSTSSRDQIVDIDRAERAGGALIRLEVGRQRAHEQSFDNVISSAESGLLAMVPTSFSISPTAGPVTSVHSGKGKEWPGRLARHKCGEGAVQIAFVLAEVHVEATGKLSAQAGVQHLHRGIVRRLPGDANGPTHSCDCGAPALSTRTSFAGVVSGDPRAGFAGVPFASRRTSFRPAISPPPRRCRRPRPAPRCSPRSSASRTPQCRRA